MQSGDVVGDLHIHTTASDGTVDVAERIDQAQQANLNAIAVTDHDTIAPELKSRRRRTEGLEVVTGVEVRADLLETKIEILGYYVDPTDDDLLDLLTRARQYRKERNDEMIAALTAATGLEVSRDKLPQSDGPLGRPHMAQFLVENDVVPSIQAAFDEYLAEGGTCFVPMKRADSREVIECLQGADGVASLAHPGRISAPKGTVENMIARLTEMGLDGIEVWYPYREGESRYADLGIETASDLANKYGLLQTGGSDCHGPGSGKFRIGNIGIGEKQLDKLRSQADQKSPL